MIRYSAKTLINKGVFALFFSQLKKIVYKNQEVNSMPVARLSFAERLYIETMMNLKVSKLKICERLGIASVQLQMELRRGWVSEEKRYDPWKAQLSIVT